METTTTKQKSLFKEPKQKLVRQERAISGKELMKRKYVDVKLEGKFAELMGPIEGRTKITLHAMPGQGKSTLALELANYLAGIYGKVLYNSHEEKLGKSLQERVKNVGLHEKVYFAPAWDYETMKRKTKVNKYRVVVVDSVQYMGFTFAQFQDFCHEFRKRNIIIIIVSQATAEGKTMGAQEIMHATDVKLYLYKGKVKSTSRYLSKVVEMQLFQPTQLTKSELFNGSTEE